MRCSVASYVQIAYLTQLLRVVTTGAAAQASQAQPAATHPANSHIIELIDCEVRRDKHYIAMILEAGDIDLAKVLTQKNAARGLTAGECAVVFYQCVKCSYCANAVGNDSALPFCDVPVSVGGNMWCSTATVFQFITVHQS
jgi:hypothetical protein